MSAPPGPEPPSSPPAARAAPPTREALLDKVALFPAGPGCYLFLDAKHRVVYVGKANDVRARVRSYLRPEADDGRLYFQPLLRSICDASFVATTTEKEALLLENALIKRHRPRWNIKLNDDKSFLQVELTTGHPWPRARLVRTTARDKRGEVFGPYASARALRETLRHLKRWFPLRTCSDAELRQRTRPCIEHEMGRCLAPCVAGKTTPEDYARVVQDVRLFLKGKDETLLPRLRERMAEHSAALRYEQAGRVRDQIRAIERTLEVQRVAREGAGDQDVLGLAADQGAVVVLLIEVRDGQVGEPRTWSWRTELPAEAALNAFLGQFYAPGRYVPREVLLPCPVEDQALLEEVLSERRGARVAVKVEVRGERRGLVELARKNALLALETGEERRAATLETLEGLQRALGLRRLPRRVECFDVSNFQGAFTVASKVRFVDGDPDPAGYRTYRVRTVEGQDDFAAMEEVVGRRLASGLEQGDLPDLIVIDGGPPQLRRALDAAARAGLPPERTELVGLAKARAPRQGALEAGLGAGARGDGEDGGPGDGPGEAAEREADPEGDLRAFERVHLARGGAPVVLPPASLELRLLVRVRDAAHRAAVRFHRELRRKSALRSGLEEVPGVGKKRRAELLARFGSLAGVRAASLEALAEVLPEATARRVRAFFDGGAEARAEETPAGE